ncbi:hypothetical protein [Ahrensia sp. R2A130]|uniref:hypothetical protein n=1 Tax=Ahrensia sp. R2A130 TaxID=744979 RepID=UPI0012E9B622|nr:hypothetical protein [Ahrensia sp. R2A130]
MSKLPKKPKRLSAGKDLLGHSANNRLRDIAAGLNVARIPGSSLHKSLRQSYTLESIFSQQRAAIGAMTGLTAPSVPTGIVDIIQGNGITGLEPLSKPYRDLVGALDTGPFHSIFGAQRAIATLAPVLSSIDRSAITQLLCSRPINRLRV